VRWIYLKSFFQIIYIVSRLLLHLSPMDGMIPDEGMMGRPIG
jgi:hypothetical protein